MELVKVLWQFFSGLITNPWFVTLLILSILADILYPKFRGFMGEFWVKQELKKLPMDKYIVLNDIMVKQNNSTHQIDHLISSQFGIFVIEMKNYYGLILGEEHKDKWIQYLGKKKSYFLNATILAIPLFMGKQKYDGTLNRSVFRGILNPLL